MRNEILIVRQAGGGTVVSVQNHAIADIAVVANQLTEDLKKKIVVAMEDRALRFVNEVAVFPQTRAFLTDCFRNMYPLASYVRR